MAEAQLNDPHVATVKSSPSFRLEDVPLPTSNTTILCVISTAMPRPFVPHSFRRVVFQSLHSLTHSGMRATVRLVATHYICPKVKGDVHHSAQSCLSCQRSKVQRHTVTPLPTSMLDSRFDMIHIDIFGSLTPSRGFTYLLTYID